MDAIFDPNRKHLMVIKEGGRGKVRDNATSHKIKYGGGRSRGNCRGASPN
jgi:hypothetical protein